jgi:hypothetical protein
MTPKRADDASYCVMRRKSLRRIVRPTIVTAESRSLASDAARTALAEWPIPPLHQHRWRRASFDDLRHSWR